MHQTRITLDMTMLQTLLAMCEGNPGAISVCTQLLKQGAAIDPDNAFEGFGYLLSLDTHGIYGSRIWMLYKDVCRQDIARTCAVLRAVQLGIVSEAVLNTAIDNYGEGLDVADACAKVKERLPKFQLEPVAA